eukprot:TRINITY_DN5932_c0_g1_i1.p3 TRINITY_DN5932_c0_g1~~TRINITY_DN5932_c0_g1_i1.p3  ORF type:complete len:148 (-),score=89.19 TRINITY_DN5932_c0_g1_i1:164-607(-)
MARAGDGTAEFIVGDELTGSSPALEMKIINQLKIATQPAISKVLVDWGQLGALPPPAYDEQLLTGSSTATGTATATAPSAPTGEQTLVTLEVDCADTVPGEELVVIGSVAALGQWDPSKALHMVTHEGAFSALVGERRAARGRRRRV